MIQPAVIQPAVIQPPASQPPAIQSTSSAPAVASRDTTQGGVASLDDPNTRFERAMLAMFQAPSSAPQHLRQNPGVPQPTGGTRDADAPGPRGRSLNAKEEGPTAKRRDEDRGEAQSLLDPRIAGQQPVLDAQQRLMRSADVADRAAAELRGEVDAPTESAPDASSASDTQAEAQAGGRAARSHAADATNQSRHAASQHDHTPGDSHGKSGTTAAHASDQRGNASSNVSTSGSGTGYSRQNGADARQQAGTLAARGASLKGAAATPIHASSVPGSAATSQGGAPSAPGSSQGANAPAVAGPGSLASVRDPLRSFAARAPKTPQGQASGQADVPTQVARGLAAAVRQRDGVLTLRLSPESLGDIKIQVRVESGQVSARIDAQTDQARQLLTESTATLRSALEAHGLVVERIEVAPAERHATTDPAMATAPFADQRAQGGALSPTDQPSPHGFGDGAPPEHRDTPGHHADDSASDSDGGTHAERDEDGLRTTTFAASDALDLTQVEGHWVLRIDLVA